MRVRVHGEVMRYSARPLNTTAAMKTLHKCFLTLIPGGNKGVSLTCHSSVLMDCNTNSASVGTIGSLASSGFHWDRLRTDDAEALALVLKNDAVLSGALTGLINVFSIAPNVLRAGYWQKPTSGGHSSMKKWARRGKDWRFGCFSLYSLSNPYLLFSDLSLYSLSNPYLLLSDPSLYSLANPYLWLYSLSISCTFSLMACVCTHYQTHTYVCTRFLTGIPSRMPVSLSLFGQRG